MTALLTDNLPLLAGAPNGIKKLRELILELAVRGKLVEQNASDEPASELLKRIAAEKARLVAEGKLKKQKSLIEVGEEEKSFCLPAGWAWVRLAHLSQVKGGKRLPAGTSFASKETPYVYIQVTNMKGGTVVDQNLKYIDEATRADIKQYTISKDDLYITIAGTIGDVGTVPDHFDGMNLTENAAKIVFQKIDKHWLQQALSSNFAQRQFSDNTNQLAQPKLALHRIADSILTLPPLAEQHRIVAKVDELMALCDRLEAQQTDAASAHAQLVQALLGSLTQASDANDFSTNWQRLAEHFHTLFTTESSIDALKQTLLQLAVMGKLVHQDPNDEPASELLKRIAEEKAQLVAQGMLKKQKPVMEITEDEKPFELPPGWCWVRVGEAFQVTSGGTFEKDREQDNGAYLYVKVGDMNMPRNELEIQTSSRFIDPVEKELRGLIPGNSIIFPKRGGAIATNKKRIVRNSIFADLNIMAIVSTNYISIEYAYLWICGIDLAKLNTGTSVPQINHKDIEPLFFQLPPLAEQHRIVAKVDQLMTLCDQLKTRLTQARQLNQQLASTLVEQAVA